MTETPPDETYPEQLEEGELDRSRPTEESEDLTEAVEEETAEAIPEQPGA
jgi:hypothetical protein